MSPDILRTVARHVHMAAPFLYPMKDLANGRIFGGFGHFVRDLFRYRRLERGRTDFPLRLRDSYPVYLDRYEAAGAIPRHYFWQDLWAARKVFQLGTKVHYDMGSRLDGFIAHCLPFCEVVMLDIRPLPYRISGLRFVQANCMDMPGIATESIASLSSLSAVEHFGLGRYGDPVDPDGHRKAISEMKRVVKRGGDILFSVPVGVQRLEFNAHRIFDPTAVVQLFDGFDLVEFSVIDDANELRETVNPADFRAMDFGDGLYHFRKRL